MPKESRSRMQKWPSSTLCPPNSTVTGTTHFYPVAIRSAHVICAQALSTSYSWFFIGEHLSEGISVRVAAPVYRNATYYTLGEGGRLTKLRVRFIANPDVARLSPALPAPPKH